MIFLFLKDQGCVELAGGTGVVHQNEWLDCLDAHGVVVVRFRNSEVLGYSMKRMVADHMRLGRDSLEENRRGRRKKLGPFETDVALISE